MYDLAICGVAFPVVWISGWGFVGVVLRFVCLGGCWVVVDTMV